MYACQKKVSLLFLVFLRPTHPLLTYRAEQLLAEIELEDMKTANQQQHSSQQQPPQLKKEKGKPLKGNKRNLAIGFLYCTPSKQVFVGGCFAPASFSRCLFTEIQPLPRHSLV
jgi:hypothetical protein